MNVLARSASEEMSKPADQTRLTHSMPYNDDGRPTDRDSIMCGSEREGIAQVGQKPTRATQTKGPPAAKEKRKNCERKKEGRKKRDATMKMNQSEHIKEAAAVA